MNIMAKMYRGQYRAVEEALETWKGDHAEAMGVRNFEEVIRLCLVVQAGVLESLRELWNGAFSGRIRDPQGVGLATLELLDAGIKVWQAAEENASTCIRAGYVVHNVARIKPAIGEMLAAREDFARRWPLFRPDDAERGAKEIAEGKFVTGEELLRELHGQGS